MQHTSQNTIFGAILNQGSNITPHKVDVVSDTATSFGPVIATTSFGPDTATSFGPAIATTSFGPAIATTDAAAHTKPLCAQPLSSPFCCGRINLVFSANEIALCNTEKYPDGIE